MTQKSSGKTPAKSSISRAAIRLNVLVQVLLYGAIFLLVNYLGFNHYRRWDFSRDRHYTLSQQTRRVVEGLKRPVKITAYFSGGSPVAADIGSLLREYGHLSKTMLEVEFVDPFLSGARARQVAQQHKLRDAENVLILEYDERSKILDTAAMAEFEPAPNLVDAPRLKSFNGEAAITGALIEITEAASHPVYVLAGHGEKALGGDPNLSLLTQYVTRQNIRLEPLRLTDVEAVPADAKALVVIAPKYDFSDLEILMLRAYWEKQGRLLILLEPGAETPRLTAFLRELGITVRDDRVLAVIQSGLLRMVLTEANGDFLPDTPITKRLINVTASFQDGMSQSLVPETKAAEAQGVKLYPLVVASKGFWGKARYQGVRNQEQSPVFVPKEDRLRPLLAVAAEKGAPDDDRLRVNSARLVVIGNSSFVNNPVLLAANTANLDFILSSLNWLIDRDTAIGIAPKEARHFTLSLTQSQISLITTLVLIAMPACAALLGGLVWLRRRR